MGKIRTIEAEPGETLNVQGEGVSVRLKFSKAVIPAQDLIISPAGSRVKIEFLPGPTTIDRFITTYRDAANSIRQSALSGKRYERDFEDLGQFRPIINTMFSQPGKVKDKTAALMDAARQVLDEPEASISSIRQRNELLDYTRGLVNYYRKHPEKPKRLLPKDDK